MANEGDFLSRIDELAEQVGFGDLVITDKVDQVYAQNQHESSWFHHPRGGQDHFLRDALIPHSEEYMEQLAAGVITEEGSQLEEAAAEVGNKLATNTETLTPVEFGDLRDSNHVTVTSDGDVVYDKPPKVERLTEKQLKNKHKRADRKKMGLDF